MIVFVYNSTKVTRLTLLRSCCLQNKMQTGKHIFLLGFMGCGKSYWGKLLAQHLGLPFLDLDDFIEEKLEKSIAQIFNEMGENGFREMETEALRLAISYPPAVIACGGGTPCFGENMVWMNETGITIYIKTEPALLTSRLKGEQNKRPLLANVNDEGMENFIETKLLEREDCYSEAHIILNQTADSQRFWRMLINSVA